MILMTIGVKMYGNDVMHKKEDLYIIWMVDT